MQFIVSVYRPIGNRRSETDLFFVVLHDYLSRNVPPLRGQRIRSWYVELDNQTSSSHFDISHCQIDLKIYNSAICCKVKRYLLSILSINIIKIILSQEVL